MNAIDETIASEPSPQPSLSLENLAGDAYLKVDFTEFGYVEYKRDDPMNGWGLRSIFPEKLEAEGPTHWSRNPIDLALGLI